MFMACWRAEPRRRLRRESFRSRLKEELVTIGRGYLASDRLPPEQRGSAVQIALLDDRLTIEPN
jgi:septum formation inhibitor MinC